MQLLGELRLAGGGLVGVGEHALGQDGRELRKHHTFLSCASWIIDWCHVVLDYVLEPEFPCSRTRILKLRERVA